MIRNLERLGDLTFDRREQPDAVFAATLQQLCWKVWIFIIIALPRKAPQITSSSQVETSSVYFGERPRKTAHTTYCFSIGPDPRNGNQLGPRRGGEGEGRVNEEVPRGPCTNEVRREGEYPMRACMNLVLTGRGGSKICLKFS